MKRLSQYFARYLATVTLLLSQLVSLGFAHDQPEDAIGDFVMTDWMILSSLFGFVIPALVISVFAWRRGYFRNLEGESKTFFLTPEPDYETSPWDWERPPDWARKESP